MKHTFIKTLVFMPVVALGLVLVPITAQAASTVTTDFENFTIGSVNGQYGWSSTGPNDQGVVNNTTGIAKLGTKALRVSNATANSGFSDQIFHIGTADAAGEIEAAASIHSTGTRQSHFEASFDLAAADTSQPTNLAIAVNLDDGSGSRMGLLQIEDYPGGDEGIEVWWYSISPVNYTNFVYSPKLGLFSRTESHNFKIVVDFVEGPSNDVVKIYVDGVLKHTGTTWENYYRNPANNQGSATRAIDTLVIRPYTPAQIDNAGKGLLFDNFVLYSGPEHIPDTEITEEDTELDIEEASDDIDIVVPVTVVNPTINLSAVQTGLVAETPVEIKAVTQTQKGDIAITIPTGTQVTGSAGWNGVLELPKISNTTITPSVTSRQNATVALVISVGSSAHHLTFNNAVRLVLPGQAGKQVGYSADNGVTFTEITTLCVANTLPGGANECKMDVGGDLVVLTNHFTLFATYSVSTKPSTSRVIGQIAPITNPVISTGPVTVPPTTPTLSYTFTTLMKVGTKNADVKELQKLLTTKGFGALVADGWFGVKTGTALKAFQKANSLTADGVAGPMTRAVLNK